MEYRFLYSILRHETDPESHHVTDPESHILVFFFGLSISDNRYRTQLVLHKVDCIQVASAMRGGPYGILPFMPRATADMNCIYGLPMHITCCILYNANLIHPPILL